MRVLQRTIRRTVVMALFALAAGAVQPAAAATEARLSVAEYQHLVHLNAKQRVYAQQLYSQVLLVALDIDREINLESLRATRAIFGRVLAGLRGGNETLAVSEAAKAELLAHLNEVQRLWQLIDGPLLKVLASERATLAEVEIVTDIQPQLVSALDDAVSAFAGKARDRRMFLTNEIAIDWSSRKSLMAEKVLTDLLLIALGQAGEDKEKAVRHMLPQFTSGLEALLNGRPDLGVTAPPSTEIQSQIVYVKSLWQDVVPLIETAADGSNLEAVVALSRVNGRLVGQINAVARLYEEY